MLEQEKLLPANPNTSVWLFQRARQKSGFYHYVLRWGKLLKGREQVQAQMAVDPWVNKHYTKTKDI